MNIRDRIEAEINAAHDAAMSLEARHFELEVTSRLDVLACELMACRPDLEPASLDEWIVNHAGRLSEAETQDAMAVVSAYFTDTDSWESIPA